MSTTIEPPLSGQDGDNRYPVSVLEPPMSECLTAILQSLKTMKRRRFQRSPAGIVDGAAGKDRRQLQRNRHCQRADGLRAQESRPGRR